MRQHEDRHLEFVALSVTVRLSHLVSSPAHHYCSSRSNRFLKRCVCAQAPFRVQTPHRARSVRRLYPDRKSTRLNSSHQIISYAVFCLKKKTKINNVSYTTR